MSTTSTSSRSHRRSPRRTERTPPMPGAATPGQAYSPFACAPNAAVWATDQSRRRDQWPGCEPQIQARPDADLKNQTSRRLDGPLAIVVQQPVPHSEVEQAGQYSAFVNPMIVPSGLRICTVKFRGRQTGVGCATSPSMKRGHGDENLLTRRLRCYCASIRWTALSGKNGRSRTRDVHGATRLLRSSVYPGYCLRDRKPTCGKSPKLCPMPGWLASIGHSACCVRHSPNRGTLPGSKQMPRCCPFSPSVLISSVANSRSITSATSQVFCVPS